MDKPLLAFFCGMIRYALVLLICIGSSLVSAQLPSFIREVKGSGNEISFKEYKLKNGLTILLHEDHSNPLIHLDVTYHVGSNREEPGKSGFAHFFEHMMFQGSKHVGDEMHFKYISDAGGTLNGTTNRDRTNYFETVPKDFLPLVLWLEADRMGFLLDSVTQEKFEIQRATVKNEKGQNYDNRPYGKSREVIGRALYHQFDGVHPYRWLTIGDLEDLDQVGVDDLKKFFLRYYGPNNAVLTIGGDFNSQDALLEIQKYFGSIPKGPEVKRIKPMIPLLKENVFVSYEDQVQFPALTLTFPTVPMFHPDEPALDFLADMLGGGKSSIWNSVFVRSGKANAVDVFHSTMELAGEFQIQIRANPGKPLKDMYDMVLAKLTGVEATLTEDHLIRVKKKHQVSEAQSFESVKGKVTSLAFYQTFGGDAALTNTENKRYQEVTISDIKRVFNQYVLQKNAVILSVVPKGKTELIVNPDTYSWKRENFTYSKSKNIRPLKIKDDFDRSIPPMVQSSTFVTPYDAEEEKLGDGGWLHFKNHPEGQRVHLVLGFDGGQLWDLEDTSKAGGAYLLSRMLNESSAKRKVDVINAQLEKLGSSVSFGVEENQFIVNIESFLENLTSTMGVVYERLFDPAFDSSEFAIIKKQWMDNLANQANQPVELANQAFRRTVYGLRCVRGFPIGGTAQTINNIQVSDIRKLYKKAIHSQLLEAWVVAPVSLDIVKKSIRYLYSWKSKDTIMLKPSRLNFYQRPSFETEIVFIHKPGAAQSEIRVGGPSERYDAFGDYYRLGVLNYILGGSFNSRININLRETHGFTYGARSMFQANEKYGHFLISTGVKKDKTDSAIQEIMSELKKWVSEGLTDEELKYAQNAISRKLMLENETSAQILSQLRFVTDHNLPADYQIRQNSLLLSYQKQELQKMGSIHFNPDRMIIVVSGDRDVVLPGLKRLGYRVAEWSPQGYFMKYL